MIQLKPNLIILHSKLHTNHNSELNEQGPELAFESHSPFRRIGEKQFFQPLDNNFFKDL